MRVKGKELVVERDDICFFSVAVMGLLQETSVVKRLQLNKTPILNGFIL